MTFEQIKELEQVSYGAKLLNQLGCPEVSELFLETVPPEIQQVVWNRIQRRAAGCPEEENDILTKQDLVLVENNREVVPIITLTINPN